MFHCLLTKERRGQTIMEMLAALGVLTIGFLGILTLLSKSLGLNRVVSDNYRGTYLAAEGIEIVKSIVMTNTSEWGSHSALIPDWSCGLPPGSYELDHRARTPDPVDTAACSLSYNFIEPAADRFLIYHPDTHLYDYINDPNGQVTHFTRTVTISYGPIFSDPDDHMTVQSVVRWRDRTGSNEVNLIDYFYNPSSTLP